MRLRKIVPGVVTAAAASLLLAAPAIAYESPAPNVTTGGVGAAGGVSAASGLPNTSATSPTPQPNGVVIAGTIGGGTLILLGGLGFAYRRRR